MSTEADPKLMYSLAGLVQKITQDCKVSTKLFNIRSFPFVHSSEIEVYSVFP